MRRCGRGRYELLISPGAGVADLAAALATLPDLAYLGHRCTSPGQATTIVVFQRGVRAGGQESRAR